MTQQKEDELIQVINQLIKKVNELTKDVSALKQTKSLTTNELLKPKVDFGLDYKGSRLESNDTFPPLDNAPEWKVEFQSSVIGFEGEVDLVESVYSQQAFSEKQAIYLCRKNLYWIDMNNKVRNKQFKSYKELNVSAIKY